MARFIVLEGIDGSGKSSIARALPERLGDPDIVLTEEPTKTWLGDAVRRSHVERTSPLTEAFLFMADRVAHTEEIGRWLEEDRTVISDRYYHSTIAYQGAALEEKPVPDPVAWLLDMNRKIALEPDLVILFDVDPELALSRLNDRDELSKFEKLEFLRKVASNYRRLADMCENIVIVDSSRPIGAVLDEVVRRVRDNV